MDNEIMQLPHQMMAELSKAVIGKGEVKRIMLLALIAGGHVLIEGLPGTAKTKLAHSLAQISGCEFKRIQFTPDMMPADVTGFFLYSPNGEPRFIQGPIFANMVLADELNRTTPRTQAALLEAMQEYEVTIERTTYPLSRPFMVMATQMPLGAEGTYPLTDVQLDRFMFRAWSQYVSLEEEKQILANIDYLDEPDIAAVASGEDILKLQEMAKGIYISDAIVSYIVSLIDGLRRDADILSGPSSRAGIALFKGSRALALLEERDFVIPDDVKQLVMPAVEHRLRLKPEAEMDGIHPKDIVGKVLEQTPVPKVEA